MPNSEFCAETHRLRDTLLGLKLLIQNASGRPLTREEREAALQAIDTELYPDKAA